MSSSHPTTTPDLVADAHRALARADRLLKVSEAAARWDCSKRTVWRLIGKGVVPFERKGPTGRIRIRESVVERLDLNGV